jgi:hypothetical protein
MGRRSVGRKAVVAGAIVAAVSMIVASCTLPAPAKRVWKVKADSIEVVDQEDWDPGDEPYAIQLGFRSKLGVANSSQSWVNSQCTNGTGMPATDVAGPGETYSFPPGAADIVFPEVQNLDVGDILLQSAPFEIFGTFTFVMERDTLLGTCAWTETIVNSMPGILRDSLNLLIAAQPVPPTQEQLVQLIIDQIDNFLSLVVGALLIQLEGVLGGQDDLLGLVAQIHLPMAGTLANLLNFGLNLAGLDNGVVDIPELGTNLKIRIGNLLPSSTVFEFSGTPAYEVRYRSRITAG